MTTKAREIVLEVLDDAALDRRVLATTVRDEDAALALHEAAHYLETLAAAVRSGEQTVTVAP